MFPRLIILLIGRLLFESPSRDTGKRLQMGLPNGCGVITGVGECLHKCSRVVTQRTSVIFQSMHARITTGENRCSIRHTNWRRGVKLFKQETSFCEPIYVRCPYNRMPKATEPTGAMLICHNHYEIWSRHDLTFPN